MNENTDLESFMQSLLGGNVQTGDTFSISIPIPSEEDLEEMISPREG